MISLLRLDCRNNYRILGKFGLRRPNRAYYTFSERERRDLQDSHIVSLVENNPNNDVYTFRFDVYYERTETY